MAAKRFNFYKDASSGFYRVQLNSPQNNIYQQVNIVEAASANIDFNSLALSGNFEVFSPFAFANTRPTADFGANRKYLRDANISSWNYCNVYGVSDWGTQSAMNASFFGFSYVLDLRNFNGYRSRMGPFARYAKALSGGKGQYLPTGWDGSKAANCANEPLPAAIASAVGVVNNPGLDNPKTLDIRTIFHLNSMKALEHAINYIYLKRTLDVLPGEPSRILRPLE